MWDLRSGREAYRLDTDHGSINAVSFSSNKKWLAAAGVQHTIQIWDVAAKSSRTLTGHQDEVTSISFSPEENLLASGSTDKTIRLWDPATGRSLRTLAILPDHVNAVAFSPDGKSLAAGCADKTAVASTARKLITNRFTGPSLVMTSCRGETTQAGCRRSRFVQVVDNQRLPSRASIVEGHERVLDGHTRVLFVNSR